jgi:hypothetical protein
MPPCSFNCAASQVAAQWEEEGWVDPASFAELLTDEEALKQVRGTIFT